MNRKDNAEAIENLFQRLRDDFGPLSDKIIRAMGETIGGMRLTLPDMENLDRFNRNMKIKTEFTGFNYKELADRHGLQARQTRRIVQGK